MAEEVDNRSTVEKDLAAFYARERGEDDPREVPGEARSFQVEGNDVSGYVGVSPEYQNYANETEKPLRAEEGVEAEAEERALASDNVELLGVPGAVNPVPEGSDGPQNTPASGGEESGDAGQTIAPPPNPGDEGDQPKASKKS